MAFDFTISDLRDQPDFFDIVADRIWRAWWERHGVSLDQIHERLKENLGSAPLPTALVAHRGDVFAGTASLIVSDMEERPDYTPWVAAVWTEPAFRGAGIAPELIARAVDLGFSLGHPRLYLSSAIARLDYYRRLGWTPVEHGIGNFQLSVFIRERDAL